MSNFFIYKNNQLFAEGLSTQYLAQQFGTPLYVYSLASLKTAYQSYANACAQQNASVHYAVKANSNLAVLNTFARLGAGFDIVSEGELARVIKAQGNPNKIIFSGVGKSAKELADALEAGIQSFNVESIAELKHLAQIAQIKKQRAPISLRINPNINPNTHPYISTGLKHSKFGIAYEDALHTYRQALTYSSLQIVGIDFHIGSQITSIEPYLEALDRILDLVKRLEHDGIKLKYINVGGGLGICYNDETPPLVSDFVSAMISRRNQRGYEKLHLIFEPGRSLVGNSGILLTQVEYLKECHDKNFAIVDAAMNDLIRPSIYQAYHDVKAAQIDTDRQTVNTYDIVGPVCESGDWLALNRQLSIAEKDILAIFSAGAYGFVMSSNYNSRPRAAEIMVDGQVAHVIREREQITDLFSKEKII